MAIQSFADRATEEYFIHGRLSKKVAWGGSKKVVHRKLDMLHYAAVLSDLASPPGNHLEALTGDRRGYHSIRINDQWRIVFRWSQSGPEKVLITDYH